MSEAYQSDERKTCSIECTWELNRKSVELECDNCNSTYEVDPQRKDDSQYCSHECYWDDMYWGSEKLKCDNCSCEFERDVRKIKRSNSNRAFCSNECWIDFGTRVRIGDSDTIYRAVRDMLPHESSWGVYARKNKSGECEMCGATDNLQLHHIVPLLAGGCHGAWNEMTLCASCHAGKVEPYTKTFTESIIDGVCPE